VGRFVFLPLPVAASAILKKVSKYKKLVKEQPDFTYGFERERRGRFRGIGTL